jgi:hypothetical protein
VNPVPQHYPARGGRRCDPRRFDELTADLSLGGADLLLGSLTERSIKEVKEIAEL